MSIYFNKIYIHLLLHFNIIHPPTSYSHFRQDTIKTKPENCAIWDTPEEKKIFRVCDHSAKLHGLSRVLKIWNLHQPAYEPRH